MSSRHPVCMHWIQYRNLHLKLVLFKLRNVSYICAMVAALLNLQRCFRHRNHYDTSAASDRPLAKPKLRVAHSMSELLSCAPLIR